MSRARGGGKTAGGGRASGDILSQKNGEPSHNLEELTRLREDIAGLKCKAYKSILWALRIDHQKINWELELAIEEIKKALHISEEEHTKIVNDLEKALRQTEAEANKRARVTTDNVQVDGARTNVLPSREMIETNVDEGVTPRQYNEKFVGKKAWVKWGADGKFRRVLIIDYDMNNGAHQLFHIEEALYEWLDLNKLLPEDLQWKCPTEEYAVEQDTIQLYETDQLIKIVEKIIEEPTDPAVLDEALKYLEEQKKFLETALETIANKLAHNEEQNEHNMKDDGDDGRDSGEDQGDEVEENDNEDDVNNDDKDSDNEGNDDDSEGTNNESSGDSSSCKSDSNDVSSDSDD